MDQALLHASRLGVPYCMDGPLCRHGIRLVVGLQRRRWFQGKLQSFINLDLDLLTCDSSQERLGIQQM